MSISPAYIAFRSEIERPDFSIDLGKAALCFAQLEYPDLDIGACLASLDRIADRIRCQLGNCFYPLKIVRAINRTLYEEWGFRGNSREYYDPRNSYLNEVLERRRGIPISLSIVYLEIAKRLRFPMVGIGLPGHFLLRPDFEEVGIFVDAFNGGNVIFVQDCEALLQRIYQRSIPLEPHFLEPVGNRQILARMLINLKAIYLDHQQFEKSLELIDLISILLPDRPIELRDRGVAYYHLGQYSQATADLLRYLSLQPAALDRDTIFKILEDINKRF